MTTLPAFLRLPLELRLNIYRHILISDLNRSRRTILWRPISADDTLFRIGYFPKDFIMPLLLANRQVHHEAISVLYGENIFVCQVSGFSDRSLAFFDHLPIKYLYLLRETYIQTGYHLEGKVDHRQISSFPLKYAAQTPEYKHSLRRRDVNVSATILEKALPAKCPITINTDSVIQSSRRFLVENIDELWGTNPICEWNYASWHLWKMVSGSGGSGFEFRRLVSDGEEEKVEAGVLKEYEEVIIWS